MLPPANTGTGTGPSSSPRRSSTTIHGLPDPRLLRERELPLRHLAPAILHRVLRGVVVAAAPNTTTKHAHHHIHLPGPAHVRAQFLLPSLLASLESELGDSAEGFGTRYQTAAQTLSNFVPPGEGGLAQVRQQFLEAT